MSADVAWYPLVSGYVQVVTIEPGLLYCERQSVARPDGAEDEIDALVGVGDHLG